MNLFQALAYFLREAARNLWRGWRAGLLAASSIGVSLFLVGFFLLLAHNLTRQVEEWRGRARVLVYARPEAAPNAVDRLEETLRRAPWAASVERVAPNEAAAAFGRMFPQLGELLAPGPGAPSLPTSFEVELSAGASEETTAPALAALEKEPAVLLVDDDRRWLGELMAAAVALRLVGAGLVAVLLGAALVTIGSVIRLKAYLDSDEITVLRLVGATEFYIRGPFYAEALCLGLIGGLIAGGALWAAYTALGARFGEVSLVAGLLRDFLPWPQAGGLVGLGAAAGLAAAVLSLRRERLGVVVDSTA